jgi:hypothetical protein
MEGRGKGGKGLGKGGSKRHRKVSKLVKVYYHDIVRSRLHLQSVDALTLKGQCHEIFDRRFFLHQTIPLGP